MQGGGAAQDGWRGHAEGGQRHALERGRLTRPSNRLRHSRLPAPPAMNTLGREVQVAGMRWWLPGLKDDTAPLKRITLASTTLQLPYSGTHAAR
jgi:hypothetical protein